ncbi:MAG: 3-phosphoshikimate 1-carboxyvinyltransferase [Clostridiales bacterium]|nr:3-phosphoshikimate 1-carboxyvinyltransferase [Clostridiales bacterium]
MRFSRFASDKGLSGVLRVPGDKSLSHRAVLFSAMAEGTSVLCGLLDSADVRSTIDACQMLGARVEDHVAQDGSIEASVTGWGATGPARPSGPIDCGNSGTTARLLLGVMAGWDVEVTLIGDESLSRRPMSRVTWPLALMGATCVATGGHLPVTIRGGTLEPLVYESPVASAQVKTAILLAGIRANGRTVVREPARSRDHTERLLPAFGVTVGSDWDSNSSWVDGPVTPSAACVRVPGDPSSAAFIAVAAALVPGSEVRIDDVALNPTRTGFIEVMRRMGASITTVPDAEYGGEPAGSITVRHSPHLMPTIVTAEEVPSLVDEIPVLALLASAAEGETVFLGVGELRVKESDRLAAIVDGLRILGVDARAEKDTLYVRGPARLKGGVVLDSMGDHRLAMVWALAGIAAEQPVEVIRFDAVEVSYPGFARDIAALRGLDR